MTRVFLSSNIYLVIERMDLRENCELDDLKGSPINTPDLTIALDRNFFVNCYICNQNQDMSVQTFHSSCKLRHYNKVLAEALHLKLIIPN